MTAALLGLATAWLGATSAGAPTSSVATLQVKEGTLALGAPLVMELEVQAAPHQVDIDSVLTDDRVRVISVEPQPAGANQSRFRIVVQPLAVGDVTMPGVRLTLRDNAGNASKVDVDGPKMRIPDPLAGQDAPALAPERPLRRTPWSGWPLVIAALFGVVAGLIYAMSRRSRDGGVEAKVVTALTAWDAALAALEALEPPSREDPESARNRVDAVSDVLREYITKRYGVRVQERTTEEFLEEVRTLPVLLAHESLLRDFLSGCDHVKFAGQTPSRGDVVGTIDVARNFVLQTKPVTTPDGRVDADRNPGRSAL